MTTVDAEYVEKRREKRITISSEAALTNLTDEYTLTVKCCNYSQSGILVKANEHMKIDTPVSVEILDEHHPLKAKGKVVRTVRDERQYLTAILFD